MTIRYCQGERGLEIAETYKCAHSTVTNSIEAFMAELPTDGEWGRPMARLCEVLNWVKEKDFDRKTLLEWRRKAEKNRAYINRRNHRTNNQKESLTQSLQRVLSDAPNKEEHLRELAKATHESEKKVSTYLNRYLGKYFTKVSDDYPDAVWRLLES